MAEPTDVRAWLEAGDALRTKLIEERGRHIARVAEIDAALTTLGASPVVPPVARQVIDVLAAAGRPMTAREIRAALPSAGRLAIGAVLYAASQRGELTARGRKGSQTYAVRRTKETQ